VLLATVKPFLAIISFDAFIDGADTGKGDTAKISRS
jgi:hypothetical protein